MTSALFRRFGLKEAGIYYALALLLAGLAALAAARGLPVYLSAQNLGNIAYQASLVGIMGVAMTVMLISGAFDLSVASVAALSAAVLVALAGSVGFVPALLCALIVGAGTGLLNGLIVQFAGINAFIVTLGTLTAVRGLVLVVTDGRSLMVENPDALAQMLAFESTRVPLMPVLLAIGIIVALSGILSVLKKAGGVKRLIAGAAFAVAGVALTGVTVAAPVVYLIALTALVWFVLNVTVVGRRLYAVGGNAEAARLSGIPVNLYKIGAFVLSGTAAGFAGVLFASRLGAINPTALQGAELSVIAAAILGGTSLMGGAGSVIKTVAGALVLFTLTNGFNILNLGANYQGLVEGLVVIAAAALYTVEARRAPKRRAA